MTDGCETFFPLWILPVFLFGTGCIVNIPMSHQRQRLKSGGSPVANGNYTIRYRLFHAEAGGTHFKEYMMNAVTKKSIAAVLLLILALIAGSTLVAAISAMQEDAGSEDAGTVEYIQPAPRLLSGSEPDEDGYAGDIPVQGSSSTDPSETDVDPSLTTEPKNWADYMQGPQPDEDNGPDTSSAMIGIMAWSNFRYINVAGATMVPRASATNWTYPGGGCISASVANDIFNIHLAVPNGSRIDYLRLYYYDTSASNSTAWLTTYNGAGGANDLTSVSSTGNSGYGTTLSAYVGHVVNTANNSYVLNWRANQTGSTMRLCGMRVAYRTPQ